MLFLVLVELLALGRTRKPAGSLGLPHLVATHPFLIISKNTYVLTLQFGRRWHVSCVSVLYIIKRSGSPILVDVGLFSSFYFPSLFINSRRV